MEKWKPVTGYEGLYDVSNLGEVRSYQRSDKPRLRGDLLTPGLSSGKRTVILYKGGCRVTRLVSHLVLEEFIGPRKPGEEARHGPRGPLDDSEANLCWGTREENQGLDRVRDGTSNRGTRQWMAKLTDAGVLECRRRYAAGEVQRALAIEFGISSGAMSQVITGARWGWLPGAVSIDQRSRQGKQGTAHHGAKLTPEIVRAARKRNSAGESQYALAVEYGVAQPTLQAIAGKTWGHVT
jgi:hypothetical protein